MSIPVDKFVNFQGSMVHYLICGAENPGDWVVLLHGKRFSAKDWKESGLLDQLNKENYKVVALELPGYGTSEKLQNELSFEDFISEFTKQLTLPAFHLVGPSFSGEIALKFALKHPERLLSLTLIDSINVDQYEMQLNKINAKTLIVWGKEDQIAPYNYALILKEKIPNNQLLTFDHLGHTCYFDDMPTFSQKLLGFLR
ncbi:putative hydrolase or acyltransferase of alpha/beta superfamily [Desulfosporosinus acidiphilus SJ4]|uniref:Putative hydrolase or acyltransferase of alpha/beta superfamily n=1 Tax=Desulfosporosinus acidiphilus (strain DSM 22704 / JCM 16185 / SJ4) TaxID=646529 RepID=I4D1T2_DESAJ|nr:alpha/beta hydrolase [Desulfosporosinus acidiphilus]AFM39756.1 putative hydrolase or acyltransferase of alpha/beta superfamily [Desulfosporosinus acidiphilus SJ4]